MTKEWQGSFEFTVKSPYILLSANNIEQTTRKNK